VALGGVAGTAGSGVGVGEAFGKGFQGSSLVGGLGGWDAEEPGIAAGVSATPAVRSGGGGSGVWGEEGERVGEG
jgi:hypothetical protein